MNSELFDPHLTGEGMTVVTMPPGLFLSELAFLLVTMVLGAVLCVRSRQSHHLLIVLASLLFVLEVLPWLFFSIPAAASYHALLRIIVPLSSVSGWFRPAAALLLTVYVLIQLLRTSRAHVREQEQAG